MLAQTIFADDYRGATVAFGAEIRAEDVAGQAGLRLEILRKGWRIEADRRVERTVDVTGSQDWARREITVTVPADTDVIRFGITLAGRGRVWLRNPELRRERPQERLLHDVVHVAGIGAQADGAGPDHRLVPLHQQPERHRVAVPGQPDQVAVGDPRAVSQHRPIPRPAGARAAAQGS